VFSYLDSPVKTMSAVFLDNPEALSHLFFDFYVDADLTVHEKMALFGDLYTQLVAKYGQPTYAFLSETQLHIDENNRLVSTEEFYFCLPMNGLEIDIDELIRISVRDNYFLSVRILFDNLSLTMTGHSRMATLNVRLFAASINRKNSLFLLPPITILPYEEHADFQTNPPRER